MASVHRLPNRPHWFCFYTDEQGARKCKTTGTTNKREALKVCIGFQKAADLARSGRLTEERARLLIESVVTDILESNGTIVKRFTVREWFKSWVAGRKGATAPATFERYEQVAESFVDFLGSKADTGLMLLRSEDVQNFRDKLAAKLSPSSVNIYLKILRTALGKAVFARQLDSNPAKFVENLVNRAKKNRRAFTLIELKKLLAAADDEWKTMILVGLYTGLRLTDAANLSWENVDLQTQEITVQTQKTGRVQILPIAKPLLRHLEKLPLDNPAAPLCPTLAGEIANRLSNKFHNLMARAGLVQRRVHRAKEAPKDQAEKRTCGDISFHALRHTATSLLKNAGVSDVIARDIIGHESEAISRQYTHIETETKRAALDKLPDILN